MISRNIVPSIEAALKDSPVVLLIGARQTGKSTLAQDLVERKVFAGRYRTFDDPTLLSAAHNNPAEFVSAFETPVVFDEVQRVPELFLAIKAAVDRNRRPGRFVLTGSANVLLLPRIADSLAGRMEVQTLWPFSQGELERTLDLFIDRVFSEKPPRGFTSRESKATLIDRVMRGGFPEVQQRSIHARRSAWFDSYITTILQRDIRDLANIEGLTTLPRLLTLLAARAGSLLNFAEISNSVGLPQTTLKRYLTLLETTFLIRVLPAWSSNLGKRLIKAPKLMLTDTGLMAHLLRINAERISSEPTSLGPLLENFVMMELAKQATWSETNPSFFHFRTPAGQEVDLVLERGDGKIVGVEVKASVAVSANDLKGLRALSESAGRKFVRGIILYTGHETVAFDKNIVAMPMSSLWQ
jgi:predicted AAA+ superfamily ATPase